MATSDSRLDFGGTTALGWLPGSPLGGSVLFVLATRLAAALAVLVVVSIGCSDTDSEKRQPAKPANQTAELDAKPTAGALEPGSDVVPRPAAAMAQPCGGTGPLAEVGVAQCDEYLSRQKTCVEENAPERIRAQQLDGLHAIATRWKQVAASDGADSLADTCTQMIESSKQATAAWGCAW